MATELTLIEAARNNDAEAVAGVVVSSSTGVYVDCNQIDASKVIFRAVSSDSAAISVKSGVFTAEGIGDLLVQATAASTLYIGPVETARFKDTDGYINLLGSTAVAGDFTVQAILLP
jgi:hypothetical protein